MKQTEFKLHGPDVIRLCNLTHSLGVQLTQSQPTDFALFNMFINSRERVFLKIDIEIPPRGLKLVDPHRPELLETTLNARDSVLLTSSRLESLEIEGTLDVEHDLLGVLRVLLEEEADKAQAVLLWWTVELAGVDVVAAIVDGSLDGGDAFIVGICDEA